MSAVRISRAAKAAADRRRTWWETARFLRWECRAAEIVAEEISQREEQHGQGNKGKAPEREL